MLVPRIVVPIDATAVVIESPGKLRPGRAEGAGASTLVPRIVVPVDATAGPIESPRELRPGRAEGAGASTLVPRILVPFDATAPIIEGRGEWAESDRTPPAIRALPLSSQAAARPFDFARGRRGGPPPALFVHAMLENSPTKPKGLGKELVISLTAHGIALAAVLLPSLYFPEAIDLDEFNRTVLAVPPALAPPPPPIAAPAAQPPAAPKKARQRSGGPAAARLGLPILIPSQIPRLGAKSGGTILVPEVTAGAPGGVPGGQLGGVVGGVVTGASGSFIPPPPAAPKSPIRVGGAVKEPRLIYQVQPIYPPLLQKAKVSGDVVIRIVIDTRGNVVEMHPVSGDPQLVSAAMDAVGQWKYEPTILAGQAVPVELTVTIQFRLT